ncbi:hypothetical protein TYRP_006043 [Tyrophagus putrescentiae]|nr:hypothetical protein TYRP_006043 [Tyrophagus putrescentiae]
MDGKNGGGGGSHLEDSLRLLFLLYIKVKFDSVLKLCRGLFIVNRYAAAAGGDEMQTMHTALQASLGRER